MRRRRTSEQRLSPSRELGMLPGVRGALALAALVSSSPSQSPVPLIIDTDIGGGGCEDVDDVAAICMANALVDNGEADLLAVVHNTSPELCPGVISVLNHYYDRDDVPIGTFRGQGLSPDAPFLPYVPDLVNNFPSPVKNRSQVPDALSVYRRALAAAQDSSVAVASIGLLTNLEQLLKSAPDATSPLSGRNLVARKVRRVAVMGGVYPHATTFAECNFCGCAHGDKASAHTASLASSYVVANMPPEVEFIFSGFEVGFQVQSGARLSQCAPPTNPCRAAFVNYEGGPNRSRYSWDPLTTLVAVRGAAAASCTDCAGCNGTNRVDPSNGRNQWVPGPGSNQTYLVLHDSAKAGDAIDDLLCQPPKKGAAARVRARNV